MSELTRTPVLYELYEQFLADEDAAAYVHRVGQRYNMATIERLVSHGSRMVRRAGALAMGYMASYESNAVLGRALVDRDRGVRLLAENSIRTIWTRAGSDLQNREINAIVALNTAKHYNKARQRATALLEQAAWYAEGWNQRAIANYCTERYEESIRDCNQTLELNPYHFGAAAGMGQCYLKMGGQSLALEAFRRALKLNPNLEGVRANIVYLERLLEQAQSTCKAVDGVAGQLPRHSDGRFGNSNVVIRLNFDLSSRLINIRLDKTTPLAHNQRYV